MKPVVPCSRSAHGRMHHTARANATASDDARGRLPQPCLLGRSCAFAQSSGQFWEKRYAKGGNSGAGSYGKLAEYKAKVLNEFIEENKVNSVVEFGCGDGNQLNLSIHAYPRYLGFEVSHTVLGWLRARFARHVQKARFLHVSDFNASTHASDLAVSLDVVYHLVEDAVFDAYMRRLLEAAKRFVIIYSSNEDWPAHGHVRHRSFSAWMGSHEEGRRFKMIRHDQHPMGCSLREHDCERKQHDRSFASFWVFSRITEWTR